MLTGTSHPHVPPRPKSRTVPACFSRSLRLSPLCSDLSVGLPSRLQQFSPVQPSFKPLPTVSAASSSPVQPSFKPLPTVSAASKSSRLQPGMDI
uniref:Uncharacterized protein n=1 Tax=Fagus sylvatica TaxID=28930 RepID=A0A2N9H009_FAGSY